MQDLTAYFITTDRQGAERSLATLEAQGLANPIVIVRNVRPLAAAFRRALACPTAYCAVVDDDVLLAPGILATLYHDLREIRARDPRVYKLLSTEYDDGDMPGGGGGGLKLFSVPDLVRVGFPDAPHVSRVQAQLAEQMGLREVWLHRLVGSHVPPTLMDVYKRYLWVRIRGNAAQLWDERQCPRPGRLAAKARATGDVAWWAACLGTVDGVFEGPRPGSKDDAFLGRLGRRIDFATLTCAEAERLYRSVGPAWRVAAAPYELQHLVRESREWLKTSVRRVRAVIRRVMTAAA